MTLLPESTLMSALRKLGSDRLAWSLRRFHCPVGPEALVLEVGSGGNPYPRANVLLDAYEETRERHWAPLTQDRPTVLGFVENLPFRDKSFDFVIASHVLEHSPDPAGFLSELERVSAAGYIEVPDAFMERINPYRDHRLEITTRDGTLLIRKKTRWRHDEEVVELYENRVKACLTRELMTSRPFHFHVRHYWKDRIAFRVINPETDATWPAPGSDAHTAPVAQAGWRENVRDGLRAALSQNRRNAQLKLDGLLRCPQCHAAALARGGDSFHCPSCTMSYPVRGSVVRMTEGHRASDGHTDAPRD